MVVSTLNRSITNRIPSPSEFPSTWGSQPLSDVEQVDMLRVGLIRHAGYIRIHPISQ